MSKMAEQVGRQRYKLGRKFYNAYLTEREAECIQHLLQGKTAKGIAETLGLSRRTIEAYLKSARNKLQCHTKSELIATVLGLSGRKK